MTESPDLAASGDPSRRARFGVFELDLATGELHRDGLKVKLQEQPFRLLVLLLERPGVIVTRDELRERLWPAEFVDFDHGLNTAVRKLRTALEDSADNPRFVETLARRGYRFIAPVSWSSAPEVPPAEPGAAPTRSRPRWIVPVIVAVTIGSGALFFQRRPSDTSAKTIGAVAVLPFANTERQSEHVSDGLTEVLIDTLAQIPDLRVTARTTVFRYKGTPIDPRRAGKDLDVEAVVAGSVRRDGEAYAIRVELVDASDGAQLWGARYRATAADLPKVHSRIAEDLILRLREGATRGPRRIYTADGEAYDLYLKGLYLWNTRAAANVKQSIQYFTRATEMDPKFAAAYGNLSAAYGVMVGHGLVSPDEGVLKIIANANKALELDPSNTEALATLATTKFRSLWDFRGAEQDYLRAIASNPSYATTHQWYADYLRSMKRPAEARRAIDTAHHLDPFSIPVNRNMCDHLYLERRFAEAIAFSARMSQIDPAFVHPSCLESTYAVLNDFEGLLSARAQYLKTPQENEATEQMTAAYRSSGRSALWKKRIELLEASPARDAKSVEIAKAYAALGDEDQAFVWLEKAYQRRVSPLTNFHIDPAFDSLRDDPRFDALRQRIGLP